MNLNWFLEVEILWTFGKEFIFDLAYKMFDDMLERGIISTLLMHSINFITLVFFDVIAHATSNVKSLGYDTMKTINKYFISKLCFS